MRSATLLLAALPALIHAHAEGDVHIGLPKIMGGSKFLEKLKTRNIFAEAFGAHPAAVQARSHAEGAHIESRVATTCGSGVGNCDAGYCCSAAG